MVSRGGGIWMEVRDKGEGLKLKENLSEGKKGENNSSSH